MTQELVHTLIKDCMAVFLITVRPYDTLARAFELMTSNQIRHLPVVEDDELVGVITLSDLLAIQHPDPGHRMSLEDIAAELSKLTVSTVMARDPICIYDNDTLGHAAELMLEHKISALPVIDTGEKVVGLVTESNIFRLLARRWRDDNLIFSGAHNPA
jgi:acetoin utilization protein AcuB